MVRMILIKISLVQHLMYNFLFKPGFHYLAKLVRRAQAKAQAQDSIHACF